MEQQTVFEVNLTKIQGDGDFPCQKCGVSISPDDESEEVYCVQETIVRNDNLEEVFIKCQKCGSTIRLNGFSNL